MKPQRSGCWIEDGNGGGNTKWEGRHIEEGGGGPGAKFDGEK